MTDIVPSSADPLLLLIGIPFAGVLLAGFIVYSVLRFKHRRIVCVLETMRHFADRGQPVPATLVELIDDSLAVPAVGRRRTPFNSAVTSIGVGIGLMLMFWSMALPELVGIGGFVVCIGAAQLLALAIEARRNGDH